MSPSNSKFAAFLTKQRKQQGLTQPELAEKIGVTKSNVYVWETGQYLPKLSVLERLARALKVSYEELLIKGKYPRHEVGPIEFLRSEGYPEEALAEMRRAYADIEDQFGRKAKRRKGRRR